MTQALRDGRRRALALLLCLALAGPGCEGAPALAASPGLPEYQRGGLLPVPGGFVNAAGGNLLLERTDLEVDTLLGRLALRAVYNAKSGAWLWSFQIAFDGAFFVGPTGARYDVRELPDGAAIPGSVFVKAAADRIETKGGLAHHFDADGRLVRIAWRGAAYPRLEYAWQPTRVELSSCTRSGACQGFLEIALDAAGRPLRLSDTRAGRAAELEWDALGRLVAARSPQDVAEGRPGLRYEYAVAASLLTAVVSSEGERIEFGYQAGRRIREVVQAGEEQPVHRFRFRSADAEGLYETLHVDPNGAETRLWFDAERRLQRSERVETGEVIQQEWSGKRVTRRVLPDGTRADFVWQDDDLASATLPSGNVVTLHYEPGGLAPQDVYARPLRRIEDSLGLGEERDYDAQGRPVARRNGAGESQRVDYWIGTVPASITAPDGVRHDYTLYGVHGHWLAREGAAPDERLFDLAGNPRVPASLARGGGILTRGWDADRRLATLEVAASQEGRVTGQDRVSIRRRSDGRPLYVARPGGGDHHFVYDAIGRLAERRERVDGLWQTTRFEYDPAGRLMARTRPNGMREEWERDAAGRPIRHRALRDGVLEGEEILTRVAGRLVARFDSLRGTLETYGYDAAGRIETIAFGYGETLDRVWDLRSRLVREVYSLPGQDEIRRLDFAYDLADRRIGVTLDGVEELLRHTWVAGRRVSTRYGNGLTRSFGHDPETGLLVGASSVDAQGQSLETTWIERSAEFGPPRSQVVSRTDTSLASSREEYWLGLGTSPADPDQRMGKRVFGWRGGEGATRAFAYDALGNPADDSDGDVFTTNAEGNRLLSATRAGAGDTLDYTWDAAGFATSRAGAAIGWTATGRLASYADVEIEWDMRGRPIRWRAGDLERDFLLFGGRVDSDPASGVLGSLDLGEVRVGFGAARRYRHPDFRGNVRFVSDESGAVVSHHVYAPYGLAAVHGEDGGVAFAGGASLGELVWLGARVYDPAVGRFLSPDPVFAWVNAYAYVMGNPLWFRDPDGAQGGPTGEDVVAQGISLALATAGILTLTPASPAAVVVLALVAFYFSAALFAVTVSAHEQRNASDVGSGPIVPAAGVGGASAISLAFGAVAPVSCAPTRVGALPDLGWLLYGLLPLQLVLGAALLRRRGLARGRGRAA